MTATKTKKAPARRSTVAAKKTTRTRTVQTKAAASKNVAVEMDTRAIREWAIDNGHIKSARGPLPQRVIDAYNANTGGVTVAARSGKTRTATATRKPAGRPRTAKKTVKPTGTDEKAVLARLSVSNPDLAAAVTLILGALREK